MDITSSPRRRSSPRVRLSSLSSCVLPFLGGTRRISSQSPSTKFMWRSNAMNLPISSRPSCIVTRIRQFIYCNNLDVFDIDILPPLSNNPALSSLNPKVWRPS